MGCGERAAVRRAGCDGVIGCYERAVRAGETGCDEGDGL